MQISPSDLPRDPVLLTIPAVTSCVVTVLALFVGITTIALSSGPGWRTLRWFGVAAIIASVYGVCAVQTTLDISPEARAVFGRLGGASASALVAAWYMYFARNYDRALARWEAAVVALVVVIAFAWLVPGVCRTSEVFRRTVPWLGATYTTTRPTAFGKATFLLLMIVSSTLAVRLFFAWRRGKRGALADFLGVAVQVVAGLNDALAVSGKVETPYALDLGQFAVVVAVGTTLVTRFVADARELERSSAELRAAQAELVRQERLAALGELSAVVAHEVRNPVTVIFSAVSTLKKEPVSVAASTLLDIVKEEAERLKRVAGELLEFARPRALAVGAIVPKEVAEGAREAAVAGLDTKVPVTVHMDDDVPEISGDEHLLHQALLNLVTNAIQAAGTSGHVELRVRPEGRPATHVIFDVTDDGEGIAPAVAEKMFTPFFTTRASGTGLGLAIVKRIVESHGGEVSWRPAGARGVTFALRVPVRSPRESGL